MNNRGMDDNLSQARLHRRQLVATTQLFKAVSSFTSIDELFSWLAATIVQVYDVHVLEIWAPQSNATGQTTTQLRALTYQDSTLPSHIIVNHQTAELASFILSRGQSSALQPISKGFASYQAEMFSRYGLTYFAGYYFQSETLLPPMQTGPSGGGQPTSTALAVLIFLRQMPDQAVISTIHLLFQQALALAENRNLLIPTTTLAEKLSLSPKQTPKQQSSLNLNELIPLRVEHADLMTSSSPFANSIVIGDKQERRLYAAIDGQKNFGEICAALRIDSSKAFQMLKSLLEQKRIQLSSPDGQLVESIL